MAEIAARVARGSGDREAGRLDGHRHGLACLPGLLGRSGPEFGRDDRTSVHEGHIIVFRYADLRGPRIYLIVIHVLSGRRDLGAMFSEPESDP